MTTATSVDAARRTLTAAGHERTFTVLASPEPREHRPLVLVFHGSKQSADAHRAFTGDPLVPLAERGDAVVAYLDGYRGNWNDARRESSFPARTEGVDDVAFAKAVVALEQREDGIDPDRVLAVGYSNGGQFVFRLLQEAPELVAAAVVIGAGMPAPESLVVPDPAPPARPVPVTIVHGTRDRIAPYDGGRLSPWARALFRVDGRTLSAVDTAASFARRNGITAAPRTRRLPSRPGSDPRTAVVETVWEQPGRPRVVLETVEGGGHTVPGPHRAPRIVGRTGGDIALAEIVERIMRGE